MCLAATGWSWCSHISIALHMGSEDLLAQWIDRGLIGFCVCSAARMFENHFTIVAELARDAGQFDLTVACMGLIYDCILLVSGPDNSKRRL